MVFDSEKDKTLDKTVFDADRGGEQIEVKLSSYDGKDPKIQISRFEVDEDERKFRKLGRLTVNEARQVRDALTKLTTAE